MPSTHLKAKAVDIGEVERGDRIFVVVELDVDETRTKNTKTGTTETQYAAVVDVLRLTGALPGELVEELRRQRREAEEEATGIAVVPGLEGFLDGRGVVVTAADKTPHDVTVAGEVVGQLPDLAEAPVIDGPVCAWLALGIEVHALRARLGVDRDQDNTIQVRLDGLFVELNALAEGDELVEEEDGLVIVDVEGEVREALELPDLELEADEVEPPSTGTPEPWDGYDALDFDGIIEHLTGYLDADRALGGGTPSAQALDYVARAHAYEHGNGGRAKVLAALKDRVDILADEITAAPAEPKLAGMPEEAPLPWPEYDGVSVDDVIARIRGEAELDVEVARELIARVEGYEEAHKKRKGILGRIGGLVPPPLPTGPDDDLNLDARDDLTDRLDELEDNAQDSELEPEVTP